MLANASIYLRAITFANINCNIRHNDGRVEAYFEAKWHDEF